VESSDEKMPPNEAESAVSNAAATKMDPETEPLNAGATADPKVKFTGGSETVDVEKGGLAGDDSIKPALTKAELMKYATDPFWVRLRWILFILFWIGWTAMLVTSIVIIIMAPKCPSPAPKSWWQKRPFYQINVESFKDSDTNGKGDLKGILEKADYLANDVGVGSIGLSPIFKSNDNKDIDETLGTLADFQNLLDGMHERDIKVVLEIKLTQYGEDLPKVIEFWSGKGVDGFRVPTTGYIGMREDEIFTLLQGLRDDLDGDEESSKILMTDVAPSINISMVYGANVTDQVGSLSQMPVDDASFLPETITAANLKNSIDEYMGILPDKAWPSFYLGKHGHERVASRYPDPYHVNVLNMLLLMLPGTPITYAGEEAGMKGKGDGTLLQWEEVGEEEISHVKIYKQVSSLRDSEVLLFGTLITKVGEGDVFILARVKKGNPGYILITNFGDSEQKVSVKPKMEEVEDSKLKVDTNPTGIAHTGDKGILTMCTPKNPNLVVGSSINMEEIVVPPKTTYLITFVPKF